MKALKIDIRKLITKSEYAKLIGVTPAYVTRLAKNGDIKTVKIIGAELILLP